MQSRSPEFDAQSMISDWLAGDRKTIISLYKQLPDSHKFLFALAASQNLKMALTFPDFISMLQTYDKLDSGGVRSAV